MHVTFLLYERFTSLDVTGPYEVLCRLPNAEFAFAGEERKAYVDGHGLLLQASHTLDEISQTDVLVVPGGPGIDDQLGNKRLLQWICRIDTGTKWTTSVCSGSLLLAHAGLLDGKRCTTHWNRREQMKTYPVILTLERYVDDGKMLTAAGVSAGIDMALFLAARIAGDQAAMQIQLSIEYDPSPPFEAGTPEKARRLGIGT